MNLFVVGLDHTSASVAVREALAFRETELPSALAHLTKNNNGHRPPLSEAVIISTCNRVELYGVMADEEEDAQQQMVDFLAYFHDIAPEEFVSSLMFRSGEAVAAHLFQTAAGLRSLVLGEAQIQGQVRKAYTTAQRVRSVGRILSRLFPAAIATGKRVRHETTLGMGAASVSQAGVALARQRFGSLEGCCVLLVGSGEVSELAAQNLLANGASDLVVVNRTYENGLELAKRYGARARCFDELVDAIADADIVISSTAAPTTVIHRSHIEQAFHLRARRQEQQQGVFALAQEMLLIDLAVPRDIAADVTDIAGVHLCTVDDLQEVVNATLAQRSSAVTQAQDIVTQQVSEFNAFLRSQDALPVLSSWRQHAETLRAAEFDRAMRRLDTLSPEQQYVVEAFSRSLVNKLLHFPTLRTKDAAAVGDGQRYAAMIRDLWGI
jgi:glutamyl-tRNA reductase